MNRRSVLHPAVRQGLLALLTGAASGAITALVMGWVGGSLRALWGDPIEQGLDHQVPLLFSLSVCGGIGVVLSVLHRGGAATLLPELPDTLHELAHPDDAPHRANIKALLGAMLALIGGGVAGPEALMTRLAALSSQRIWRGRDHHLHDASIAGSLALFHSPLLGGAVISDHRGALFNRWIPGTIGGLAGFALFHGIKEASGGSLQSIPYSWPSNIGEDIASLSAALLAALVGSGLGLMLRGWRHTLEHRRLLDHWPWWPVITGLLLGALMHWLPLVPFSGEGQLLPLLDGMNRSDAALLLVSGLVKLLMLGLCLETGWRGGIFFPVFLIACAFGSALHHLLPELGSLGSWCGGITGAFYMVLLQQRRLTVLVLSVVLLQGHGATAALVGVVVAEMINRLMPVQPRGDALPPAPETPGLP